MVIHSFPHYSIKVFCCIKTLDKEGKVWILNRSFVDLRGKWMGLMGSIGEKRVRKQRKEAGEEKVY